MSLYYKDPDCNFVELQNDNFSDWKLSGEYMRGSPQFAANPMGIFFDLTPSTRLLSPGPISRRWKRQSMPRFFARSHPKYRFAGIRAVTSALGQKQTFAVQKGMSALPPESGHWASPIECLPKAGWMKAAGAFTGLPRELRARDNITSDISITAPIPNVL